MGDASDAQGQIKQMISFIANEAQEKGEEEFSIEVHRLITEQKEKIRQGYEKKVKQIETKYAIAKSMAINKKRLEKIKARQEVISGIADEAKNKLKQQGGTPEFLTKLIVQGLLMLLEKEVFVRCRKEDADKVKGVLQKAQTEYAKVVKTETGKDVQVTLKIDGQTSLPPAPTGRDGPSCLGGVVLVCSGGKITIDNTIDARLALVMEQAKPNIRNLLFPEK